MKKILCSTVAVILAVSMFTACSSKPAEPASSAASASSAAPSSEASSAAPASSEAKSVEPSTIKFQVIETPTITAQFWQEAFGEIEKANPDIKIEKVLAPGQDQVQWLKTKLAAGDFPDIITYGAADFAAMEDVLAEAPQDLLSNFEEPSLLKNGGKNLVIPYAKQYKAQAYYNKKMFADAGIAGEPKTWAELVAACEKLKAAGLTPLISCKDNWYVGFPYVTAVAWADVTDAKPTYLGDIRTGAAKWNDPILAASLKRWQDLVTAGYYHKGSMSLAYTQMVDEFFKGGSAMVFNGSWMAPQVDQLDPKPEFEIGVFPIPQESGVKHIGAIYQYWGVYNESKVKDASFKAIKYALVDNKELYTKFIQADNLASATKTPISYPGTPMAQKFNENAASLVPVIDFQGAAGDTAYPAGFYDYQNKSLSLMYMGENIEKELDNWDKEYQTLIAK